MQGERVWNAVEYVWGPPLILDVHGRSTGELNLNKIRAKSITNGVNPMLGALFIILNGVCLYEFHKIANCARAKEACGILQVTHEGTSVFKVSKLQMLTINFENIGMHENQKFSSFYFELSDIVNSSFKLGEIIPDSKVIRKILRYFPERFRLKVITIQESRDIGSNKN